MDFSHHETNVSQAARASQPNAAFPGTTATQRKAVGTKNWGQWTKIGYTALLFGVTILVVAIAGLIAFSGNTSESKLINSSKFQAVFINDSSSNGQSVYFGHITKLASSYIVLQDIYYITTSSNSTTSTTSSANNYTLTKLGCQQLHDPYDEMVINTSQIAFWENLQNGGKVVTAIKQFQKDNPNGPNCSQTSSSVSASSTTQNSTTP
jgi:hypothetical protein